MTRIPVSKGFTLLELLFSISIFSFMSLLVFELVDGAIQLKKTRHEMTQNLEAFQKTMQLLHKDITHIFHDVSEAPFHGGNGVLDSNSGGLVMVSGGLANPNMKLKRSHLFKVGYRVQKNNLERLTWPWIETFENQEPEIDILLTNVEQLSFRFYSNHQWLNEWNSENRLPKAVHLRIKHKEKGNFTRILLLTGHPESVQTEK